MIEMKQLQYLVVCARLRSFSRAAEALYTTQPNVSKVIRSLESELGFPIFIRQSRGIRLTSRGRHICEYASRTMDHVEQLMAFSRMDKGQELLISCCASSWMTACFREFYNAHREEDVCFHIMTASAEEILRRCGEGRDDLGFLYVMERQLPQLQYRMETEGLEFVELKRAKAMLYLGKKHPLGQAEGPEEPDLEGIRLVQCYEDEFALNQSPWGDGREPTAQRLPAAVITNSDYVMNQLLEHTDLGNISAEYLGGGDRGDAYRAISLYGEERPVIFGAVRRREEAMERWAERFLDFVRERLEEEETEGSR